MTQQTLKVFEQELLARRQPMDTLMLQLESLYNFAGALGYSLANGGSYLTSRGFVNLNAPREGLKFISFDMMKYWHNNPFKDYTFRKEISTAAAARHKLVDRVKIQRTKQGLKVQNHYVKLVTSDEKSYRKSLLAQACPTLTPDQLEQLSGNPRLYID